MREMLTGGELDYLTGDYLAELTMLILARDRAKSPDRGYAKTFLTQLEECLGTALDQGVRIVANAGGLNPAGLAAAVRALAERLGLDAQGGPRRGRRPGGAGGELGFGTPLAANAYLGAWGIVDCLNSGADVVVTGRVTDASVIVGPAAAHFGWGRDDYDRLAGAVAAGHVIECGVQATGGNFAFFTEVPDLTYAGFPLAEIDDDGSSVITKHAGTGGLVSVDTVTAQLLYEITGARYANPDVTLRMDSIELSPDGTDRVRIDGVRGEPPPPTLKVSLNSIGGFRNAMTFVLTGLDIDAKADLVRRQLEVRPDRQAGRTGVDAGPHRPRRRRHRGGRERAAALRGARPRPRQRRSPVLLRRSRIGARQLSRASPPPHRRATARCTACSPPATSTRPRCRTSPCTPTAPAPTFPPPPRPRCSSPSRPFALPEPLPFGETQRVPLGRIAGARSGDKGGNANVGVWVRTTDQWRWLAHALTVEKLREMLPETADLEVTRICCPTCAR